MDYTTEYCIRSGTYYLFETSNNNSGYNIKFQGTEIPDTKYKGKTYIPGKGAFIKKISIETGQICDLTDKNKIENEPFVSIYINKYLENLSQGDTTRIKANSNNKRAGFQLYHGGKPIIIENDGKEYGEFFTNDQGTASIERIPVNSTYTLYETTFPDDIEPTIQPGYDSSKDAVKIATIEVDKEGNIKITNKVEDKQKIKDSSNGQQYYYRASIVTEKSAGKESKATFRVTNRKYMKISGYVWEDISNDTKIPGNGDNKYEENSNDKKIRNITVKLYEKGSNRQIESEQTNENGEYKFDNLLSAKDVKNGKYYVEFDYSQYPGVARDTNEYSNGRKIYTPVVPNITATNTSKSLTKEILPEEDKEILQSSNELYKAYTGYRRECK